MKRFHRSSCAQSKVLRSCVHPANRRISNRCSSTQEAGASTWSVEEDAYRQLVQYARLDTCLALMKTQEQGLGLVCSKDVASGEVLMKVPRGLSLVVDFDAGLQLPDAAWPRLRQGLSLQEAPTWDVLLALALMDGLAGDGGAFWASWTQSILPPAEALTLPLCWSQEQLQELQHQDIIKGALAQQERLRASFPGGLCDPISEEEPCSWLAWAFACVRSRAFKVGPDSFAFIPFLDLANHHPKPNADFRVAGDMFELFAMSDIKANEEVCISYTGKEGYTNQRMMAQYGFVPSRNASDRVDWSQLSREAAQQSHQPLDKQLGTIPSSPSASSTPHESAGAGNATTASTSAQFFQSQIEPSTPSPSASTSTSLRSSSAQEPAQEALSLSRAQEALGDSIFVQAISGELPYIQSALKSIPWMPEAADQGHPNLELAAKLRDQVTAELTGCATTLQQDMDLIKALQRSGAAQPETRMLAALQYRIERKQLLSSCKMILDAYCRD